MNDRVLITSALPYANGPLHFGHIAGAYLPADAYARFERLRKKDVLYVCGSDEYGVAITMSAEIAGRSPQEHVDLYHRINKDLFDQMEISFDHYSRTTTPFHAPVVQEFFLDLLNNGYIEERVTNQLYSPQENRFLADRYVVGTCPVCGHDPARGDECPKCAASYEATDLKNPRSKLTGSSLEPKPTKHWFLKLELFQEKLLAWIETKEWKPNVLNYIKQYIKDLHARAITRDSTWGVPIPLPGTEGKVLYVWFDAPIGYISASIEWADKIGDKEAWKRYWLNPETKLVHFIGKDNIPFHAVIFPAMIMGQNQPYKLVDAVPANEFLMLEGRQFSKSDNWTIDLESFFKNFTADQIRYMLAAIAPETMDSEFTWKEFQLRCNNDLVGKFGNFVNRVFTFTHKSVGPIVPTPGEFDADDLQFRDTIKRLVKEAEANYASYSLRKASQSFMELTQAGNVYFDKKRPWKLTKEKGFEEALNTILYLCFECMRALSLISSPLIPKAALELWQFLGYQEPLEELGWEKIAETSISPGQRLKEAKLLFQKVEDELIEQEIQKLKGKV